MKKLRLLYRRFLCWSGEHAWSHPVAIKGTPYRFCPICEAIQVHLRASKSRAAGWRNEEVVTDSKGRVYVTGRYGNRVRIR